MDSAKWDDALSDEDSTMHKALVAGILEEVQKMFPSLNLDITEFLPGSIVVRFRCVLASE